MNSFIFDCKTDDLIEQGTARHRWTGVSHARELTLSGSPSSLQPIAYCLISTMRSMHPLRLKFLIPHSALIHAPPIARKNNICYI